jgi:phosphomannomutase
MLDRLCDHYGVKVVETSVGFKNIAQEMMESKDIVLAVEESGGFGIRGHLPDRDGTFAALIACEARAVEGKPVRDTLDDIFKIVGGARSFDRLDIKLTAKQQANVAAKLGAVAPDALGGRAVVEVNRLDGAKYLRDDGTWVMLRLSGTEPLIRVYAEGRNPEDVAGLLEAGDALIKQAGGA